MPAEQADAHTRAPETALEGGVATRQDIVGLEQRLEPMSRDPKIWFGGALAVAVAVAVGVLLGAAELIWS